MPVAAQTGTLRVHVRDGSGRPVQSAAVALASRANQLQRSGASDERGLWIAHGLPYGTYRLSVARRGFAPAAALVAIRSPLPVREEITLAVAGVRTTVEVNAATTLLDPRASGPEYAVSTRDLAERPVAAPGRGVLDAVVAQPGWLLEANGVLHPRESEYDTQDVVNGLPLYENRSPVFAPPLPAADLDWLRVLTGGYPAEYGRKLGGIVEVTTHHAARPGWHGSVFASGGSFGNTAGGLAVADQWGANEIDFGFNGARTDRFLDPPTLANYSNRANSAGENLAYERDAGGGFLRLYWSHDRDGFLVPNEELQQAAGQRQDRRNVEQLGQLTYEHLLAANWLFTFQARLRDLTDQLWSNTLSTPIVAAQKRRLRDGYASASMAADRGRQQWKFGGDLLLGGVNERFHYRITNPSFFDPGTPGQFQFTGEAPDREASGYGEDRISAGRWNFSLGLRWDYYRLLTARQAWSPRLAASWYWRRGALSLHASYDRAFQTPPVENLLLSSSPQAQRLAAGGLGLPVPASYGDFYQVGAAKRWRGLRLDENFFRRQFRNFYDDDLLLNTGVSFPISFASASIYGWETKLEIPVWGRWSGFLSYTNQLGTARLPVTGGLFLEPDAASLLAATDRFPTSQDQRNTAAARVRFQVSRDFWVASQAAYGSGLPTEADQSEAELAAEYGPQVLDQVNFARGRLRPNFTLGLAAGLTVWVRGERQVRVEGDVENLTDRVNVIDFAGLFSGTAIAAPRSLGLRLAGTF